MLRCLSLTLLLVACRRDDEPKPAEPKPAVAPVDAEPITLAIDAPAPAAPEPTIGVVWRAAIPEDASDPVVGGNEVFVATPKAIEIFDLATGAKLRTAAVASGQLVATHDALVAWNGREEFGLDKQSLRPTWHAPAPNFLAAAGEYLVETPPLAEPQVLRLRRAGAGTVVWENKERLFAAGTPVLRDGDTLYVEAYVGANADRVAAIDVATGAVRWRAEGSLVSASGGHVAVRDGAEAYRILDAGGHVRWRARVGALRLDGGVAYASTPETTTAIELATNRVLWRHHAAHEPGIERVGGWLLAYGPLSAPEQRKPTLARGCLVVTGCCGASPMAGATVTIDGTTTAKTDRSGCFQARPPLGLGPAHVDVVDAQGNRPKLDSDFPDTVVFDKAPVTLNGMYLGVGCHDAECRH